MKLSVVIVNYNVKYFLEQCLTSVLKACKNIESEVFVVDNNSVDTSVDMVKSKFPEVIVIENKENKGFSKANNQAIKLSKGEYILLLNPDTVVEDDTFTKVIDFMDSHHDAGGLGIKMLNGKGKFLPESKRGLPTPDVAFYKMTGLSKIFPRSEIFGRYHLGYLDKDKIHQVDILSGAFMLLRRSALDKTGLLDETFFMYGEDIDLSYRLVKAGYKNYYYPETRIIHYKGESTKKSGVNYVFMFYNAMIIFARKHFPHNNARVFSALINTAIYFRAFLAILNRLLNRLYMPVLDSLLIYGGFYFIKIFWENNVFFKSYYPTEYMSVVVPSYILIWLFSIYLSGGYDKPVRFVRIFRGLVAGTVIILVIYALLSESYRFSRALILIGSVWAFISAFLVRYVVYNLLNISKPVDRTNKRYAVVGNRDEYIRVSGLLEQSNLKPSFTGLVSLNEKKETNNEYIGNVSQIHEIIEIYRIDEIIFCAKDISSQKIMDIMTELQNLEVIYKIAPPESLYIIGSNSINAAGELFMYNLNSVNTTANKRNKRFFDVMASILLLLFFPLAVFFVKRPLRFFANIFSVFFARRSWVSYFKNGSTVNLPVIKNGVLTPATLLRNKDLSEEMLNEVNVLYAKDYKIINDVSIVIRGFKNLGGTE